MKPFKILILFFSVIITGLTTGRVFGQCSFSAGTFCVPFATNTSGATVTVPISCSSGTILSLTASSELSVVSTTGIGTNSGSITVRCAANSKCPGKVMATFGNASCPSGAEKVVNKSFTQANLNAFYTAVFGVDDNNQPRPYAINATGCLDPGGQVTLSVVPLGCSAIEPITWQFVDAAGNTLPGWTERYRSTDGSSITVDVPNAATFTQPCTVKVRVGVCAATNVVHAQRVIFPSATAPDIQLVSGSQGTANPNNPNSNGMPLGGVFGDRTLCVNADFGANIGTAQNPGYPYSSNTITLQAVPDESNAGVAYSWTVPQGFDLVSATGNQAVIRVYGGVEGASGVITVRAARANSCAGDVARMTILRRLVPQSGNATVGTISFNAVVRSGGISPTACNPAVNPIPLEVKQDYTLTIANLPLNSSVTWACANPGNQPFWEFRPAGSNKESTVYNNNLTVNANSVVGRYRIPPNYTGTMANPVVSFTSGTCTSTLTYSPQVKLPNGMKVQLTFSGSNQTANNTITVSNNGGTSWPPTGCGTNSVRYIWSFQGTFTGGTGSPYGNTEYEGIEIFPTNNILGINNTTLAPGTYNGIFRIAAHNGSGGCTYCFGVEGSVSVTNMIVSAQRPAGGGGDEPLQVQPTPQLRLSPNPAGKEVQVEMENISEGGRLEIRNGEGKTVKTVSQATRQTKISLIGLPKGLYSVAYLSPNGERVSEKLVVE